MHVSTARARHAMRALCVCLLTGPVFGCNADSRASVEGKVTYAGQTVDEGGIAFIPIENETLPRATGQIHAGHYKLDQQRGPEPGKYRVEITWRKKTGNKIPGEGGFLRDEREPGIPPKYNTESDLTREVKPGRNTLDFNLSK